MSNAPGEVRGRGLAPGGGTQAAQGVEAVEEVGDAGVMRQAAACIDAPPIPSMRYVVSGFKLARCVFSARGDPGTALRA